jgi:diguanylate cyclase (GGDEF)-like protein
MKILIAEDDENSKQLLIDLFESQGHQVIHFDNGIHALSYLQLNIVDLIISDILMPELDGYGLCRAVKQNISIQNIPFIFYTATYTTVQDERFAMSLGAAAFLVKPMDLNEFLSLIADITSKEHSKVKTTRGRGLYRATPIKVDKQHTDLIRSKLDKKIKELNEEHAKLIESEAKFRDFAEASADCFWETDANLNMRIVSGGCEHLNFVNLKELASRCQNYLAQDLFKIIESHEHFSDYIASISCADSETGQTFLRISGKAIFNTKQQFVGYRGVGKDVSEMIALSRKVEFLATHDGLTGLPNRNLLKEQLARLITKSASDSVQFLVLYIDLDHFKVINDTMGHDAGDTLLSSVTNRIKECARETDYLYRIGGDEFAMVLETATPQDGHRLLREIISSFNTPFNILSQRIYATVSIGVSVYPDDTQDAQTLLNYADMAMYRAKKAGRNSFEFYSPDLNFIPGQWVDMEQSIRLGLHRNEFEILYQPQVSAKHNKIVGVEALLRWNHPDHGLIPTTDFIKIAEQSALVNYLDDWVLERVCKQLRTWIDDGYALPKISINMSARHLRSDNLVKLLSTVPKQYEITPNMICIEITEHAILEENSIVRANMLAIKNAGFTISLDDFGTGHSSLLYLKRWDVDEVKIDRTFINDLVNSDDDRAIVKAMVALAEALGLHLVAEGVENQHQVDILQASGCCTMQGYFYAMPMKPAEMVTMFSRVN